MTDDAADIPAPGETSGRSSPKSPRPASPKSQRPDPLDREWRHPAELPGRNSVHHRAREAGNLGWGRLTALALTSAMVGSILTVGILGFSGLLSGKAKPTVRDRLLAVAKDAARTDAAAAVRPSIVEVTYPTTTGPSRAAAIAIEHGGVFVTTSLVASNIGTITITDAKGDEVPATLLGSDTISGLAFITANLDIPAASLAKTAPSPSNSVIVVGPGNAIGEGIVNVTKSVLVDGNGVAVPNLLVTNALQSYAEPGSALVDGQGRVAGVVLAGAAGAIPIDYAREVLTQLRATPMTDHAWIGLRSGNSAAGPVVHKVDASSPAFIAGMVRGDLIRSINGRNVYSVADVQALVRWRWALDKIDIVVQRGELSLKLTMTAVTSPTGPASLTTPPPKPATTSPTSNANTSPTANPPTSATINATTTVSSPTPLR